MQREGVGLVAVVAMLGWSCAGSPGPDGASGGTTGASGGAPGDGSGGGSETGGAPSVGGASPAGGAVGSGGAATGGQSVTIPADLFPLAVGNIWTYSILEQPMPDFCDPEHLTEEVYALDTVGGREGFVTSAVCFAPSDQDSRLAAVDGEIQQWIGDMWHVTLAAPLKDGHRWILDVGEPPSEFSWQSTGTVTVPAGTFENCWSRVPVPVEAGVVVTYCLGVGPVRRASAAVTVEMTSYELAGE